MSDTISLKYKGPSVDNGLIDIKDLISGLEGLSHLSKLVLQHEESITKGKAISLKVNSFNHGSFETIISIMEKHPVLTSSATAIVLVTIEGLFTHILENGENFPSEVNQPQIQNIINVEGDVVLNDMTVNIVNQLVNTEDYSKVRKGVYEIVKPLKDEGVMSVEFGPTNATKEIANQGNKHLFLSNIKPDEFLEPINMTGELRVLDKKTKNGKFVSADGKDTYSISLVMSDPENYFQYYDKANIAIFGNAVTKKDSKEIVRIEVEDIRDTSRPRR